MMNVKSNAVDLSAKLLATENISVRRARTKTASFDIESRVLTIPQWKDMSPTVEGMVVGHEVGHALYTTTDYLVPIKDNPKLFSYLNIIEDVRIEKLMKRKYPGIRKTMTDGYKELNDKDFFGVREVNLSTLNLIDRINLYFKAGFSCGVTFTQEEREFVVRAEKTETTDDVITLSKEIYDYVKEQAQKKLDNVDVDSILKEEQEEQERHNNDSMLDENDLLEEDEDYSYDSGDKTSVGRNKQEILEQMLEEEIESKTDKEFTRKLNELADSETEYLYHFLDSEFVVDPIVSYKTVISETESLESELTETSFQENFNKFKTETQRNVNYLVKEFEMRKSATQYKRSQVSKIGSLDMKKIWSYKLSNDLFKRIMTVPNGKNHGMIFLLDWSGSMDGVLQETVEQVITLAMFCQRAQIPYQVFAFSSQYDICYEDVEKRQKGQNKQINLKNSSSLVLNNASQNFALLEFLSSKMTNVEFNKMIRRLYSSHKLSRCKRGEYSTGGTPLNEALSYMVYYIPKFISSNNIEKMTFITLTDGEGGCLWDVNGSRYSLDDFRSEISDGQYKKIKQKHFLTDELTKKNYPFNRYSSSQTESILRMIKDRYGITTVGFYLCYNSRRNLNTALHSNIPNYRGSADMTIEQMRKDFRTDGFYSMKNTGRDDLFIVPTSSLKIDYSELQVSENQTAKQIAKNFSKLMSGKRTSRILLNKFIGYVA